MALLNADLSKYEQQDNYTPIPPGEYTVRVIDSEVRESKAGNPMARFTFEVMGPTHSGRKLWDQFVLNNEVALRRLKTLASVAGHRNPNFIRDTEELHGLTCMVKVAIEEQEGYEPKNIIKSFKAAENKPAAANGVPAPHVAAQALQQSSAAPSPQGKFPWAK